MASRRVIQSLLHNFIGTYVSRYSASRGYWLFGMLVNDLGGMRIDLLAPEVSATENPLMLMAMQLARTKFQEQAKKAHISLSYIREAHLIIVRSDRPASGMVNGRIVSGHEYTFLARAISDLEHGYQNETRVFIAPHDPSVERQSAKAPNLSLQSGPAASGRPLS
jgi:hypothetical protein